MQVVLLCRGSFYTCNEDLLEKPSGNYSCGKVYDEAKKIHHNNTGIQFLIFSKFLSDYNKILLLHVHTRRLIPKIIELIALTLALVF